MAKPSTPPRIYQSVRPALADCLLGIEFMKERPKENVAKAIWNDTVVAESNQTIEVDGYTYFPPASVRKELLIPTATTSTCPWKGSARYFSVGVNGTENPDAAWTYEHPKPAAARIKGYVAFWRGVQITN